MVRAKKALSEHLGRLIFTPAVRDGRPVYQVSGGLTLAPPDGQTSNAVGGAPVAALSNFYSAG